MADYIDRKALGIGKCNPDVFENKGYAEGWNSAIEIIESALSADVVEPVRCKLCKHWVNNTSTFTFSPTGHCFCHDIDTLKHDFCSYGERKIE